MDITHTMTASLDHSLRSMLASVPAVAVLLISIASFVVLIIMILRTHNRPEGHWGARLRRNAPLMLLQALTTGSLMLAAWLDKRPSEEGAALMMAPFFNLITCYLGIVVIAGLTHSKRWLATMWLMYGALQMILIAWLYRYVSGSPEDIWWPRSMLILSLGFMVLPALIGWWAHKNGLLDDPMSARSIRELEK
jgi:hypothetical protein